MPTKPLTKIQQIWLDHLNQATAQNLSMSAYAQQNNLALKSLYSARSSLIKKGRLPSIKINDLVPIIATPSSVPIITTSCRMILCNGIILELADVDISDLLNSAKQL
jgi:hypothetical protein